MNKLIGNMGVAIIGLTFVIKLILFPLAWKSFVSMSRMKGAAARDGEDQGDASATTA